MDREGDDKECNCECCKKNVLAGLFKKMLKSMNEK